MWTTWVIATILTLNHEHVETKEELEGGEVREEVCMSAAAVDCDDMAHERECMWSRRHA